MLYYFKYKLQHLGIFYKFLKNPLTGGKGGSKGQGLGPGGIDYYHIQQGANILKLRTVVVYVMEKKNTASGFNMFYIYMGFYF